MVRGLISLVVVATGVLGTVGLVAAKPRLFERVLPPELIQVVERMTGAGASDKAPGGTGDLAAHYLVDRPEGLLALGPIAARAGNEPVFLATVITGYSAEVSQDIPAEITTIRTILGCKLTPPGAGSLVGHATAATSDMPLALRTYNDAQLAAEVQAFVDQVRDERADAPVIGPGPAYEAYNVAVTETGAPVYLVLENLAGNRIWNIHTVPGARIERVILLGGAQAGVANLDPVVPVEVLLGDGLAGCGITPAYLPNAANPLYQAIASGDLSDAEAKDRLAEVRAAVDAYDLWFRDSFGVTAGESRIGFDRGTLSVIGPAAQDAEVKASFRSLAGARIRTTQDQFFEITGQVAAGTDFASRVRAIATTFAFGNLDTLKQGVTF